MVLCFNPVQPSSGDRSASTSPCRVKAETTPLGKTRSRLIQVLQHLGFYSEKIAYRLRDERESDRALELDRLVRLQEDREAARRQEEARAARFHEEKQSARLAEELKAARLLKEDIAYQSMSEEQQADWRLEAETVSWLMASGEEEARG
jgi:hypothetical protein